MPVTTAPKMYLNGKIVDYADCKIHAFASVVKYGTGVFEGLRGYWNAEQKQLYIFRLREHMERLRFGLKAMRYADIPAQDELERAIIEVSRANDIRATAHFRLIAFLDGDDELSTVGPTGLVAGAVVRGSSPRVEKGMAAMISSYVRINDNALPPRVKCTANYVNNRAAELEDSDAPWARGWAWLLRGSLAADEGRRSDAESALLRARGAFAAADMEIYAQVARRALGVLRDSAAEVDAADAWMRGQNVTNPARVAWMLCPTPSR